MKQTLFLVVLMMLLAFASAFRFRDQLETEDQWGEQICRLLNCPEPCDSSYCSVD